MEENSVKLLSRILEEAKEEAEQKKKHPKKEKSKLWILFLMISILLMVGCISIWLFEESRISEMESTISSLKSKYSEASSDLNFWENNAVLVTETGDKYHRKGCQYVQGRNFLIYNVEKAVEEGYSPCSVCLPNAPKEEKKSGIDWDEVERRAKEQEKYLGEILGKTRTTQ